MQIVLEKDVEAFVAEQVKIGAAGTASELVNDALRALSLQCRRPFETTSELEAWLLEAADNSSVSLCKSDFEEIRVRVRERIA